MAEMLEETLHRPGRGVAEPADGVTFDAIGQVEQQIQLLAPCLPVENALERAVEPAGALAAGRALAAGLRHIEARQALVFAYHAGGLVHHDHRARTDARARGLDRVVI